MIIWQLICLCIWFVWTFVKALTTDDWDEFFVPSDWSLRDWIYVCATGFMVIYILIFHILTNNDWLFREIK